MALRLTALLLLLTTQLLQAEQKPLADTVSVPASTQYGEPSLLNYILLGKNYRKEWSTPVCLPVFSLQRGRYTIQELGGGMQTKSLYIKDVHGEDWVLRTVDKDPSETVPGIIKNRTTVHAVQQLISAAHPYAPLTIPVLAKAGGVQATDPRFYYVPDDPAFGSHRDVFANTVCLLERKNVTAEKVQTLETEDLLTALLKSNNQLLNQQAYLRARLLDMLIGDWDRHEDQWLWAAHEKGRVVSYEALPKDRDQAYFHSQGLLVKLMTMGKFKHLTGFTRSSRNIKRLNNKSWNMDRLFLNELSLKDWQQIVQDFHDAVSEEVIDKAVKQLPPEVYKISGEKMTDKLVNRRRALVGNVLKYYKFLSKDIIIYGSDDAEVIELSGNKDSVTIVVKGGASVYSRTFYSKETSAIHLFALGGNDVIRCTGLNGITIRLQIDAGKGDDEYAAACKEKLTMLDTEMDAAAYEKTLKTLLKIKDE